MYFKVLYKFVPEQVLLFLSFTADIPVSQKEYKVYCSIFVVQNKLVYVATYLEIPHQYVPRWILSLLEKIRPDLLEIRDKYI